MFESEALKSLGQWPLVQGAVAIVIIFAGVWLMRRGEKDKKQSDPMPQWLLMGPLHDMMGAVYEISEQGRQQTDLLRRIEDRMGDLLRQAEINKSTLETIRNESRLR
jgi:hypothetical protein